MSSHRPDDFTAVELTMVKAILEQRGIHLDAAACGCCQGPWIRISIDGVMVLDTEETCFDNYPAEDGS